MTTTPPSPDHDREQSLESSASVQDPTTRADDQHRRRAGRAGTLMLAVFLIAEVTFVLASFLVLVPFAMLDPTFTGGGPLPPRALLALVAVPTVLAALVAIAGTALLRHGPRKARVRRELAVHWSPRDIGLGVAIGAGGLLLTLPAAAVWSAWVGEDQASSALGEAFDADQFGPAAAVAIFLTVWLLAPFCEEVLFRGALWRSLEHWRWNRWVIFIVTTLVFSVAHLELLRAPLLLVLALPIGLARLFTGNLLAAVVAHQVNNFLPAVSILLAASGAISI